MLGFSIPVRRIALKCLLFLAIPKEILKILRFQLIVSPYIVSADEQRTYNRIEEIAREEGIAFINYNEYYDEIGIDFEKDFNDGSHLNYWGSCKFTEYLGEYLVSCGLPDRRGQEGYESWEDNAQLILDMHGQI